MAKGFSRPLRKLLTHVLYEHGRAYMLRAVICEKAVKNSKRRIKYCKKLVLVREPKLDAKT